MDLSNSISSEMEFPAVALRASSSFPEQDIREMLSVHEKGRRVSPGNKNWVLEEKFGIFVRVVKSREELGRCDIW